MNEYRIEISATAEKQLRQLPRSVQRRIVRAIRALAGDPRPRGCRQLRDYDGVYRVRTGRYRILYSIEDNRLLIIVLKLGHRKDVYR